MPHETTLIATIAAAFVLAFTLGFAAAKLKVPPLVGYLLAGVVIGPFTPGFVGDISLAAQLAEIGVILLMFGVGLHFSIKDLMAVRNIAIPGAVAQIATATAIGVGMAHYWGWSLGAGLVFGLSLSVASTVVLLRALESRGQLDSPEGRIAIGWLIVEDLVMVLALVLLPALAETLGGRAGGLVGQTAGSEGAAIALALTLGKVAVFVALALVVGTRVVPWLLMQVARTGSRELFTLGVLAIALGIAFGSAKLFGVSFALGAFFAGVILSESELSAKAGEDSLPLQDAFAVLFFVSVGMLFDPSIVVREPLAVLGVVLAIVLGKSVAAFVIVLAFRYPARTALTVSASLAQIGEFSFILASLGVVLDLLPDPGQDLILAGALLSITLNPLAFAAVPPAMAWLTARPRLLGFLEARSRPPPPATPVPALADHAVIVGHGRVGAHLAAVLAAEGLPYIVIERDRARATALAATGVPVIAGDVTHAGVLESAGIARARLLVVATPDSFQVRRALELSRAANAGIYAVVRTHSESEFRWLAEQQVGHVVMGERELARSMLEYVLRAFGVPPARAALLVADDGAGRIVADSERR